MEEFEAKGSQEDPDQIRDEFSDRETDPDASITRSNVNLATDSGPPRSGFVKKFRRWSTQIGSITKVSSTIAPSVSTSDLLTSGHPPSGGSPGSSRKHLDTLSPSTLGLGPLTTTQSCIDVSMQQKTIPKNAAFSKSTSELDAIGDMRTKESKNVRNKRFEQQKKLSISSPNMRRSIANEEDNTVLTPHSNHRKNEKFHKIFKNVPEGERVLNYYSCALVSEILLQGVLYISDNFFGFYSNVFGHITKILIPVKKVTDIKKTNTAMLIPNAIKILADTKKFTFTSLISRDATYRLMHKVWHHAIKKKVIEPDSTSASSVSCSNVDSERNDTPDGSTCDTVESTPTVPQITEMVHQTSVFQACMGVLGVVFPVHKVMFGLKSSVNTLSRLPRTTLFLAMSTLLLIFLYMSAAFLIFRLNTLHQRYGIYVGDGNDNEGQTYREVYRWQNQMHTTTVGNLRETLATQIQQLVEVRKSLETLKMAASEDGGTFQDIVRGSVSAT